MKILVLASSYPYTNNPSAGIYNERSVHGLRELCELVAVLAPRPLSSPILARFSPRWKNYADMAKEEVRGGISIFRPAYLQVPRLLPAFWLDPGMYFWCREKARTLHRGNGFDAILAFGLTGVGGLAWRLARDFGIPAAGWATGSDVRAPGSKAHAKVVSRSLCRLDMVFYQSQDLRSCSAKLQRVPLSEMDPERHLVLPRGIPDPPNLRVTETRERVRNAWKIHPDQILVLFVGRIVRQKGVFDLLEAMRVAASRHAGLTCVLVGSVPGFDDSPAVQEIIRQDAFSAERVRILPACAPETVWELLCGADIFAFPSYSEGMPNALLEAMVMGIPSIAYAIPPVIELEGGSGGVTLIEPGNITEFAAAILRLSMESDERVRLRINGEARVREHFMAKKNIIEAVRRINALVRQSTHLSVREDLTPTPSSR